MDHQRPAFIERWPFAFVLHERAAWPLASATLRASMHARRSRTSLSLLLATCAALVRSAPSHAHPIVPDGVASEWITRSPAADDSARIVRDRDEPAEFVWRDRAGDARSGDDITELRMHGNPDGIGFFVRFASAPSSCAQLQLAIDLDRVAASGASTFAGDGNTRVRSDIRPELIVVATAEGGVVRDPSGVARATFGAGVGAEGMELFVPWTALGMARWPLGMTVSAALFCAPDRVTPVAPADGASSAVIDAITDYGRLDAAVRSTRDEVLDGSMDHGLALHFGVSGTIREALHLMRMAPTAEPSRGGPWFELVNRSDDTVALDRFAFGDEPIPGGSDGLAQFPPGLSVAPGGRITIALDGAAFRSAFGVGADLELRGTDPSTPDATPLPARGRGTIDFDPAGDEVAIFDQERTLLDLFNYNAGAYPTFVAFAPLARNDAVTRSPSGVDVDDNSIDFYRLGVTCSVVADCDDTQCNTCTNRVCIERPDGLTCDLGGCPSGRCSVGACVPRADAAVCATDAASDAGSDGHDGALSDAADARAMDSAADSDAATSAMDSAAMDAADESDAGAPDAPDSPDARDVSDASVAMDRAPTEDHTSVDAEPVGAEPVAPPSAGCACSAPARASRRGVTPGAMIALGAFILRRRPRRRAN